MASLGHLAVGLAAGRLQGGTVRELGASMLFYSALSYLPDLDTVGFALGIPYGAPFGHRGAFHSLGFALGAGAAIGALAHLFFKGRGWRTGALAAAILGLHGLLDTLTDGGRGIALFCPWTAERFFAPWRPIPVAPIGPAALSPRGLWVIGWELKAFAPLFVLALWPRRFTRQKVERAVAP